MEQSPLTDLLAMLAEHMQAPAPPAHNHMVPQSPLEPNRRVALGFHQMGEGAMPPMTMRQDMTTTELPFLDRRK